MYGDCVNSVESQDKHGKVIITLKALEANTAGADDMTKHQDQGTDAIQNPYFLKELCK